MGKCMYRISFLCRTGTRVCAQMGKLLLPRLLRASGIGRELVIGPHDRRPANKAFRICVVPSPTFYDAPCACVQKGGLC
jgi:hypothetical protein